MILDNDGSGSNGGGDDKSKPEPKKTKSKAKLKVAGAKSTAAEGAETEGNTTPAELGGIDPFDPAYNQLAQDYGSALGVKTALLSLKVRKPDREWWVRTHSDKSLVMSATVLEAKPDKGIGVDYYLLPPHVHSAIDAAHILPVLLIPAINRVGTLFLWLVKLPRGGGDMSDWSATAIEAANLARDQWVQVVSRKSHYDAKISPPGIPDPEWPEISTDKTAMFKLAFKDFCINSADHVLLRKLRNEI